MYCENNPLTLIDPTGLGPLDPDSAGWKPADVGSFNTQQWLNIQKPIDIKAVPPKASGGLEPDNTLFNVISGGAAGKALVEGVGTAIASKAAAKVAIKEVAEGATAVAESASSTGGKAVVIGEGMGRVKDAAKALQAEGVDAKWYQAWGKNFPKDRLMTPAELNSALARNQRWITSKIKQGYQVFDIGKDVSKANRSPFYALEKQVLNTLQHPVTPY